MQIPIWIINTRTHAQWLCWTLFLIQCSWTCLLCLSDHSELPCSYFLFLSLLLLFLPTQHSTAQCQLLIFFFSAVTAIFKGVRKQIAWSWNDSLHADWVVFTSCRNGLTGQSEEGTLLAKWNNRLWLWHVSPHHVSPFFAAAS